MRIGVSVACAGRQDGGPETFELGLVRALVEIGPEHEYEIFCPSQAAADAFAIRRPNVRFHILWPGRRAIGITVGLPIALLQIPVDVLHATLYPPILSPVDYVFTMHDVTPFVAPGNYPASFRAGLRFLMARGLRNAKLVVCATEHSRQTTIECCGVAPERISAIHHGLDPLFRPVPDARAQIAERYGIRAPYALYVGKLIAPKNLARLVEAFSLLRREAPDLRLVLCGRRFWNSQFLDDAITRFKVRDCVIEPGYVPTADLPLFYAGAEMTVYVSHHEGFGFPILEAMASGSPVITSTSTCLPEVAGGAALLVNPDSVEEIAAAMWRLHTEPELGADLRKRGIARAATFTWERAAAQYLAVYGRAAGR